ncbi:hypothetical protein H0H92_003856 [Tricholoma furcatifolium]|nr:hypothetical protein H0H92_003856 [Tricholoma furcatifolium]
MVNSIASIQREAEAEALHTFECRPISPSEEQNVRVRHERQVGGQTPLLYAMQYGKPCEEVILFLVGAISQWINRLNDADFSKPVTMKMLKLARANLKFAIDEGLAKLQTGLIASFLQTLVMCEGDRWIRDQIMTISFALKGKGAENPVEVAGSVVRRFCTTNLQNADLIADVEDYTSMANATA